MSDPSESVNKPLALDPEIRAKTHIPHLSHDFDREHSEFPIVNPGVLYTV